MIPLIVHLRVLPEQDGGYWGEDGDILIEQAPCFITTLHQKQLPCHQIKVLL